MGGVRRVSEHTARRRMGGVRRVSEYTARRRMDGVRRVSEYTARRRMGGVRRVSEYTARRQVIAAILTCRSVDSDLTSRITQCSALLHSLALRSQDTAYMP